MSSPIRLENERPTIGIIGFGRFGQLLAHLLADEFHIIAFDQNPDKIKSNNFHVAPLPAATIDCHILFVAVPIRQFAHTIQAIADKLKPGTTIIDVCSVKIYPVKVMLDYLPGHINIIATHPLFGPDSVNNKSSRRIMMHPVRGPQQNYEFYKALFQRHGIQVLEMTPEQHDELAAKSQSITHFIGRVLDEAKLESTSIDTKGFQELLILKQQTCNDSWELFFDLQEYNPYSKQYIDLLMKSVNNIYNKILTYKEK